MLTQTTALKPLGRTTNASSDPDRWKMSFLGRLKASKSGPMSTSPPPQAPTPRIIHLNNRKANRRFRFVENSISTTKYTILRFLPDVIGEQVKRIGTVYSLTISILSAWGSSPMSAIKMLLPPCLPLLAALIKEAWEDWKRSQNDMAINDNPIEVLQDRKWVKTTWKKLQVGDIVRVTHKKFFPADLLFLASEDPDGSCYVETSKLDGETDLKTRKALERTWAYLTPEKASEFEGEVQCEHPNNSLYTFIGNLIIKKEILPLTQKQILLRGCRLRNPKYIVGAVIFTGHETKTMMNAHPLNVRSKRSTFERKLNKLILVLFGVLFTMCLTGAVGSGLFVNHKYSYLALMKTVDNHFNPDNRFSVALHTMYTLIILYSTIVPASLYTCIEIIRLIQSIQFINKDPQMGHTETNTLARPRTSNLNEELGQVEYILSDKTGTLTTNLMEFAKCSIGGEVYGVDDSRLLQGAWRNEPSPDICKEFFRCLAICHTVHLRTDEDMENTKYYAASPDEIALVTAAKDLGFFYHRRRQKEAIYVHEFHVEKMGERKDMCYEILHDIKFDSKRKRQSVVCRFPNGRLVLYCKGADSVIFERLADVNDNMKKVTKKHLEQFGSAGLRTLCLAYRDLKLDMYESWNKKFIEANGSERDHKKLGQVIDLIEKDLLLIGCIGLQEKLQESVRESIETLSGAGIKIWVLSGDSMETTTSICCACNLIKNDMEKFIISSDAAGRVGEGEEEEVKKKLKEAQLYLQTTSEPKLALIIDGKCLKYALEPSLRGMLLNLCLNCSSVVCYRVSPSQKAEVTTLVKKHAHKITLSVGDGANDVNMIQAAHIGVGIKGQEGTEAVRASDFEIAEFRFLTDLLLVHGRQSSLRSWKLVEHFFCKNLTLTLTQFWFSLQTGFSGQSFYNNQFPSLCELIFTALPVIVVGLSDKDVSASLAKECPQLYKKGKDFYFRWRVIPRWALFSIYQSLILYYFVTASYRSAKSSSGKMFGLWDVSTMGFTCYIVTTNLRLLLLCESITRWHYISIGGSISAWFVFLFFYPRIRTPMQLEENVNFTINVLMRAPYFYLTLLLVPVVALLGDFICKEVQRWFFSYQIVQEKHRGEVENPFRPAEASENEEGEGFSLYENHAESLRFREAASAEQRIAPFGNDSRPDGMRKDKGVACSQTDDIKTISNNRYSMFKDKTTRAGPSHVMEEHDLSR